MLRHTLIAAALVTALCIAGTASAASERGTFTATDGARVEYYAHGPATAPTLLFAPAFTASAQLYADRFGEGLPDYRVVVLQLRGHGTGGGCTFNSLDYCTQQQRPSWGTYRGFRMSRLAADLRELKDHLHLTHFAMGGHSLGMNVVTEYISDYGTTGLDGLFVYDQSPKNLAGSDPENASFPPGIATYPIDQFTQLVDSFESFTPKQGYVNVKTNVRAMLGGPTGNPVFDPTHPAPAFLLRAADWYSWARFADRMNGKVLSLLFWSSITSDYTDVYRLVAKAKVPTLVYGGKSSLVPWRAMQWVHEQVPGSEFMLFGQDVGVHGAFLNPPPSGPRFMRTVKSFLDRRVRAQLIAAQ
jgi:pimeloyl-ACP methyl ester carboxylesterase